MRNHLENALLSLRQAALHCQDQVFKRYIESAIRDTQRLLAKHQAREQSTLYNQYHGQLRFLSALDNEVVAQALESMIRTQGHEVDSVRGGADALGSLESGAFDIVILDMTLPDAKMITALEQIRARDQELHRHTPVVALTNLREDQAGVDEWLALLDACVNSPVLPERFFEVVQRVLARSSSWF